MNFNTYTINDKYTKYYIHVYKDILFSYKQFKIHEQKYYNMYPKIISHALPLQH